MVDYKGTVAELQEILKSRGLPTSGKKADLIARLQDADKEAEVNEVEKAPPAPSTSAPPNQTPAAEPIPEPTKPIPTPATTAPEPTAADTAADSPSANTDTALANSANYALHLPSSTVDDEMAKRKARAERFGTSAAPGANGDAEESKDDDAQKALERAKRFGNSENAVGKLDMALSQERERGLKRKGGAERDVEMDDPGLLRRGRGRGGFRGRRRGVGGPGGRGGRPDGVRKEGLAYSSDRDRSAAEARKKRFAAA